MTAVSVQTYADLIRLWWRRHGSMLLVVMTVCMLLAAVWRLATALPFLLWLAEDPYPTDIKARYGEVSRWFEGIFEHPRAGRADYPPASYPMLWPLLGWLSLGHARWLWGLTALAALGLMAYQMAGASGATTRAQRLILLLLPFSGYATSATMSVGQLGNHVVPMLMGGLLLLQYGRGRWWEDAGASVMLLFALVKPILSAPFFWIVCFATGRTRPIVLVTLGYVALTLFAASFQTEGLYTVLTGWLGTTPNLPKGHVNLHKWLASSGLVSWTLPATAATLLACGWWIYRHRRGDFWILAGVAALVTRLGFHHRIYDDLLLLIPMITLFRMATMDRETGNRDVMAAILFALTWATLHLPAQLFGFPPPVPAVVEAGQATVWIAVLLFLLGAARRETPRTPWGTAAYEDRTRDVLPAAAGIRLTQ